MEGVRAVHREVRRGGFVPLSRAARCVSRCPGHPVRLRRRHRPGGSPGILRGAAGAGRGVRRPCPPALSIGGRRPSRYCDRGGRFFLSGANRDRSRKSHTHHSEFSPKGCMFFYTPARARGYAPRLFDICQKVRHGRPRARGATPSLGSCPIWDDRSPAHARCYPIDWKRASHSAAIASSSASVVCRYTPWIPSSAWPAIWRSASRLARS